MTARNPKARYASINMEKLQIPKEIEDQSILIQDRLDDAIQIFYRSTSQKLPQSIRLSTPVLRKFFSATNSPGALKQYAKSAKSP